MAASTVQLNLVNHARKGQVSNKRSSAICSGRSAAVEGSTCNSQAAKLFSARSVLGNSTNFQVSYFKPSLGRRSIKCMAAGKGQVAITGATGFVGSALVERLVAEGYEVKALTRSAARAAKLLGPGVEVIDDSEEWAAAVAGCAAVVNLAGEPISTRWSEGVKQEIVRSRVDTTEKLAEAINGCNMFNKPGVFISASAIGFYGVSDDETFTESDGPGEDFLAQVCIDWEAAAAKAKAKRSVVLRLGIVLDNGGGAIGKMKPIFQLGGGGPLGDGNQWFSWIHRDDVVEMIVQAIQDGKWKGVYNATAPNPVSVGEMTSALGSALSRPAFLPVPAVALELLLGEGATLVLDGQQVLPTRALKQKFDFKYSTVDEAMEAIAGN